MSSKVQTITESISPRRAPVPPGCECLVPGRDYACGACCAWYPYGTKGWDASKAVGHLPLGVADRAVIGHHTPGGEVGRGQGETILDPTITMSSKLLMSRQFLMKAQTNLDEQRSTEPSAEASQSWMATAFAVKAPWRQLSQKRHAAMQKYMEATASASATYLGECKEAEDKYEASLEDEWQQLLQKDDEDRREGWQPPKKARKIAEKAGPTAAAAAAAPAATADAAADVNGELQGLVNRASAAIQAAAATADAAADVNGELQGLVNRASAAIQAATEEREWTGQGTIALVPPEAGSATSPAPKDDNYLD